MRASEEPVFALLSCLCRVSVAIDPPHRRVCETDPPCVMQIDALRSYCYWRVEPDADDRSGRQRDVLAVGRRNRAARANHGAEDGSLHAAEKAAYDAADACADSGRAHFLTDAAALEDAGSGAAHVVLPPAYDHAIERERQASGAFDAPCGPDTRDDATDDRAGRDEH